MFSGNMNLRGDSEALAMEPWQLEELRKCVRDPIYFAKNYVKITTKDKGVQLFEPWDFQCDLIQTMKNNRFVISKFPRQSGKCVDFGSLIDVKMLDGTVERMYIGDLFELIKEMELKNDKK